MKFLRNSILAGAVIVLISDTATARGGPGPANAVGDCVILLHGMARTSLSMNKMQSALMEAGYHVVNDSYPSREFPIETLAPMAIDAGLEKCAAAAPGKPVHFVTHSLGGILVRYYFANRDLADRNFAGLGRVVMLAPPNQGSAASDRLREIPGFDFVNGPAGRQLGKGDDSLPLALPAPTFEFAVIAGNRTIDPVTSAVLSNPDDGKVSVEDTKLEGMTDFAVVNVSHAFIMRNNEVIRLVLSFLRTGKFKS